MSISPEMRATTYSPASSKSIEQSSDTRRFHPTHSSHAHSGTDAVRFDGDVVHQAAHQRDAATGVVVSRARPRSPSSVVGNGHMNHAAINCGGDFDQPGLDAVSVL